MQKIKFTYRIAVAPMDAQLLITAHGGTQNLMPILARIEPENGEILDGRKVDLLPYFQALPEEIQQSINRNAINIFSQIEETAEVDDEFSFYISIE